MDSNDDKKLISVSSGNIEFNKLIRNCTPYLIDKLESSLQDLKLKMVNGHSLNILRGGLVANFTGKPDSSLGHIIQMTRALLFSAIIQIVGNSKVLEKCVGAVSLSVSLQNEVVNLWFEDQPNRKMDYGKEIHTKYKVVI